MERKRINHQGLFRAPGVSEGQRVCLSACQVEVPRELPTVCLD